jgi:uncharacterized membrane protein YjjB (DUF3815 family)
VNPTFLLHQTIFGALAATGFGVLFNVPFRQLGWCAVSGAVALSVRTACQQLGASLVASSFAAALLVGITAHLRWTRTDISHDVLRIVGCIPLVPGGLASKAILALFALTRGGAAVTDAQIVFDAVQNSLRVIFTIGAIGTGLVIPMLVVRTRARP